MAVSFNHVFANCPARSLFQIMPGPVPEIPEPALAAAASSAANHRSAGPAHAENGQ
jgi:hypothetical protein